MSNPSESAKFRKSKIISFTNKWDFLKQYQNGTVMTDDDIFAWCEKKGYDMEQFIRIVRRDPVFMGKMREILIYHTFSDDRWGFRGKYVK